VKDTYFKRKTTLNCKGKLIDISTPKVMGIVNTTPDSFYDGGTSYTTTSALKQVEKHLIEGANFIDIGGYSSRPGAKEISEVEELARVIPVIKAISNQFPEAIISIDTFRSEVARQSIQNGASIINDISAGELDNKMFQVVSNLQVPYIIMHMQGKPKNMQDNPEYNNIIIEIGKYFAKRVNQLRTLGTNDIVIDVGFGFGKTLDDNYQLLANLSHFEFLELPILTGISRKSMVYKQLDITPENALNGSSTLHMIALQNGSSILRVHDVKEAVECVKLYEKLLLHS